MSSPEEMAATMLRNLPDKTGRSLTEWHTILKKTPLDKHGQLVGLLKFPDVEHCCAAALIGLLSPSHTIFARLPP